MRWTALLVTAAMWMADGQVSYDVVVRGGDVYVGDGSPAIRADVALRSDRVAVVGHVANSARRVVDATGMAVAPGFINMLSWSTESLIVDGRAESEIRQGVTTHIFGEGQSMGPLNAAMKRRRKAEQTDLQFEMEWTTLAEYLRYMERRGVSANVASFVGAGTVREHVMGMANRPATTRELEQMARLVESEMKAGALGVGSALIYAPGSYATTDELVALCRVAARYGGMYASHVRNQAGRFAESVDELIRISREAGIAAEVYHFGIAGEHNQQQLDRAIEQIEAARRSGLRITADMHAYSAGGTGLTMCLPPWAQSGNAEAVLRRLQDPAARKRIAREIRDGLSGWDNPYQLVGSPERLLVVSLRNPDLQDLEGQTLSQIAADRGRDPIETLLDLIVEDRSSVEAIYFTDREENVRRQVQLPWMTFGSDAAALATDGPLAGVRRHPRGYGNFARVLGRYVREEKLISWESAIHRMTGLPAENLGLERRGLLREGYFADLVVFDRATVTDQATFVRPNQYAVGVRHVFVNGVAVLEDGRHTDARPGRALARRPLPNRNSNDSPARPAESQVGPIGQVEPIGPIERTRPIALLNVAARQSDESYRTARDTLVRESLEKAEPPITNARVLEAMRSTPRHLFVLPQYRKLAYVDTVLPIGSQQTISPPYIVAYMTQMIDPQPSDRVLEIGTGSGYQAAVLSPLVEQVYTIEIVEALGKKATEVLRRQGYSNVFTRIGDGYKGWPEKAPFHKIIVTCSPDHVPEPLANQLAEGGTMIIPVGERYQQSFYLVQKRDGKLTQERLLGTFFVPMTGEAEQQRRDNPDGTRPSVANGGFEAGADSEGGPESWYYQRGVRIESEGAPEGKQHVSYRNQVAGHLTHSNQGFAVDGRQIEALELTFSVKTESVRSGTKPGETAGLTITFFDRNRSLAGTFRAGPYDGSSRWIAERRRVLVPRTAHDAVIMIGLHGATGMIEFDDIRMTPIQRAAR